MKWKLGILTFLLAVFAMPLWAHHGAQGIISDDIWERIDDQLAEVDSPHLNIDFDDVMGSMRASENPDTGATFLVTSAVVDTEDVDDYLDVIAGVMADMEANGEIPSGIGGPGNSGTLLDFYVVDLGGGLSEIVLEEAIGAGASQVDPGAPGPPAGGGNGRS